MSVHWMAGAIANIGSVILISVIMVSLCNIHMRKTTRGHSSLEAVPTLAASSMAVLYETVSSAKPDYVSDTANAISLELVIAYLFVYCQYSSSRIRVLIGTVATALIALITVLSITFYKVPDECKPLVKNVTGGLYLVFSITAFATPVGVALWEASQNKRIKSVSRSSSIIGCANCMIWIIYAATEGLDIITLISNVSGLILNGFQYYLWYRTSLDWWHYLDGNILPSLFQELIP